MTKAPAKSISTVTEDKDYLAAHEAAERARQGLKSRIAEREDIRKAAARNAPIELDAEALLDGEKRPDQTPDHTLDDQFARLTGEIKTLRLHVEKLENAERKARQLATGKIAEGYVKARKERVERFHQTLGPQYEVGMETTAMINHLNRENGDKHGYPYTATTLHPLPQFQKHWLIKMAAMFFKSDGLQIPKPMLADAFAVEELRIKYRVTV